MKNFEIGVMYAIGGAIAAMTHSATERELLFPVNEEEGLDMFSQDKIFMFGELEDSDFTFGIDFFGDEVFQESTALKVEIPENVERDLRGLNYSERLNMISQVKHIDLWLDPQMNRPDKYSSCWIWVQCPHPLDDIKYIPIVVHNGGGVSVHPHYHKHFLRNFTKDQRHLVLGFCYLYGPMIAAHVNWAAENDKGFDKNFIYSITNSALRYNDKDAPKRIDSGPSKKLKYNPRYKPSYDDYRNWVKANKDKM